MRESDHLLGCTFSVAERLLRPLVTPSTDLGDERAIRGLLASVAVSALIEPGDMDAGLLVEVLGVELAATFLMDDGDGDRLLALLRERSAGAELPTAERLDAALARWRSRREQSNPERVLERAAHLHATLVPPGDPLWPRGLDDLQRGCPLLLWVRGDTRRLTTLDRSIAMVGARAATGYGTHVAMESAAALSDRGFAVVSGGAYGIDAAAHRAAVASGQVTVAFLAGGVDRLYPSGNATLLHRVIETGLVVSELPPGSAPTRWRFLMRNRLIAAAAQATVVIEAGSRSGSLNTAGHAAQLGRPLGAVPGPVTSPASAGCHRLIREYDAVCVTTPDEMAELCEPIGQGADADIDGEVLRSDDVLGALRIRSGRTLRELMAATGLNASSVQSELGRLEALGRVRESGDGWHRLVE
ncbi:DNA-processing protein DprA [Leifsonia sp. NPDC080035]|uniref:DNA-processing protein DprA n=1 Tax=Leifsonia sp. NPDC080035 TaxID=3143936 RepID=A0AAU7G812_9MICO